MDLVGHQNNAVHIELIEDRHGKKSTIITSQIPVSKWHDVIGDKTVDDSILDKIIYESHRLELRGDSLRKQPKTSTYEVGNAGAHDAPAPE